MATGKITKSAVDRLQPGWLWDTECRGFGARRQLDGVFYYLRYRFNRRQRIKSIGRHGSPWTPDTARTEARRLLGGVADGVDPLAANRAAEGFGEEVRRYLGRKRGWMKPRAYESVERHLMQQAKPLHLLRLSEIDRRTCAVLLAEIETSSGPIARNRLRTSLSAFFAWAITEGFIEVNPAAGTAKADEGATRERVLNQAELAALWRATAPAGQFNDIVRLLVLTGQRRNEIAHLRWSEIDRSRAMLVLPPQRTKNKRLHELPLSPQALAILDRQTKRQREYVFGDGDGGFQGFSLAKARLDQRLRLSGWRLHDLRRTAATMMAELGVLPHIIEAVLNHVSGHKAGVAGIYNRARYESEMRQALERWAEHVERFCDR